MEYAAIAGGCLVIVAITYMVLKMLTGATRKGARNAEKADSLAESAERRARADAEAARPIVTGNRLRALARRYRERRLRDLEGR